MSEISKPPPPHLPDVLCRRPLISYSTFRDAYEEREALQNNPRGIPLSSEADQKWWIVGVEMLTVKTSSKCPSRIFVLTRYPIVARALGLAAFRPSARASKGILHTSRISTRVDPSEPISAQYDHSNAPPTASALRKQRLKSTPLNADLLKGFAEISEDVGIRPSERKAARQVLNMLRKLKDLTDDCIVMMFVHRCYPLILII